MRGKKRSDRQGLGSSVELFPWRLHRRPSRRESRVALCGACKRACMNEREKSNRVTMRMLKGGYLGSSDASGTVRDSKEQRNKRRQVEERGREGWGWTSSTVKGVCF